MIVPMKHMPEDPDTFDPTDTTGGKADVSLYNKGDANLAVGELIICNDSPDEQGWFVAQVQRRKPNEIVVRYYHTPTPFLEEHDQETNERRLERLNKVTFRKTWIITNGKNHGKATSKPPYPKNEDLRTWDGTIPLNEIYDTVLIRGVKISAEGKLSPETAKLAVKLSTPHEPTITVEVEKEIAAPSLFLRSEEEICSCQHCFSHLSGIQASSEANRTTS